MQTYVTNDFARYGKTPHWTWLDIMSPLIEDWNHEESVCLCG